MWAFYRKFFVWEQRKLGDIATPIKTYSLTRAFETLKNTNFKYIHYGDIHTGKAKIIQNPSTLPTIKKNDNYITLKTNDIIIADASEDYKGIADAAILKDCGNYKIVAGLHTIAIRPNSCNVSSFIYILLGRDDFKHWGYKVGTGLKVFGITLKNFLKYKTFYPSLNEQKAISNLLNLVDNLLDLQKRKTALTKRIYLGILQKLFSNYSLKKYKRYKLKDVSISKKGKEIKKNEIFKTGKYAVVHYADLYKFYPVQKNAIHFSNKKLGILIPNNSLLFPGSDVTPSGLARTSTILQKNVFAGNDVIIFCLNENKVSAQFLSYELNFLKEEILSLITGTTIKHIYIKDLENMDIFLPSMKVQKLIENVLNKITYKRISNKNIIFQLSKFKQFLLQNMFI